MNRVSITLFFVLGITTATLAFGIPRPGLTTPNKLQCKATGEGFRISVTKGQSSLSLLSVSDASGIQQNCGQIATRLERAINAQGLDKLMIVAHSIGRRDTLCVVQSDREGCRQNNLLLDVPNGWDRARFLDEILDVNAETFFSGSAGQHTRRRYYARFGKALAPLLSQ